ncbi:MAG: ATP-binding protein, partial [Prevotellaceae bacterium]|nr:ATP-binding protein [Prevotellaceae bacterium]
MKKIKNPFVVGTYVSAEYFCDREAESALLTKHIDNGINVTLTAPRRLGKTGLIRHFLSNDYIQTEYYTFFVDLYSTNSLAEMVQMLANAIFEQLQPTKERWWERFSTMVSSLNMGFSIDAMTGEPSFNIGLGQIHTPEISLDQIFRYLETADRSCIVAIDEFQQIANYQEKNVEALLRTKIQRCVNTHFIYC